MSPINTQNRDKSRIQRISCIEALEITTYNPDRAITYDADSACETYCARLKIHSVSTTNGSGGVSTESYASVIIKREGNHHLLPSTYV
ncbi:hypothetical protein CEXT_521361 [Caerostris extrusa]|uniref:Uncharacterized protein n=1 Tax=Caerostris extrusa TaxID=172846 RepID=A0AAV4V4Z4_CAEEX|nr:hypothetical protein CEXT_521361 [Caerostris extrusa]